MNPRALAIVLCTTLLLGCPPRAQGPTPPPPNEAPAEATAESAEDVQVDRFADIRVLRYRVPGFDELPAKQKELVYYLYEAALSGRDIIWDQNYKHNLYVRRTLEAIVQSYKGSKDVPEYGKFLEYVKRVWFANGIHHHYSMKKFVPEFTPEYFAILVANSDAARLPLEDGQTADQLVAKLTPILFDPKVDAKRVNLDPKADMIKSSANNFYENVSQKDVERFYKKRTKKKEARPISHGLNSKLIKTKGKLEERVWKVGGMYGPAIEKIVFWLEKASGVAENAKQKAALDKLIAYYKSGDLATFDEYNIAWVNDADSRVDVVNGFIEVYGDPLGYRGTFESVVSIRDLEATKRIAAISKEAQWFEDNSTIPDATKKKKVTGISAKVITVVVEAGDASPSTPIGINLPNSNWIRTEHGSKSVNLGNIVHSYDLVKSQEGTLEEFSPSPEVVARAKQYSALGDILHTDLHEVIGHASGQINPGVGTPKETLKNYSSTLEEGRADLVALYYLMDPKLVEIGVMPNLEVGKASYDRYIRNGLMTQLVRLEPGADIEEAHMRNRQMVAKWVFEKGATDKIIERVSRDGKTYFQINDYDKLRKLFGDLLREVQRIKSEGDYKAGRALIEDYGVKVDPELHAEVLARYAKLQIAPYSGFVNARLVPVEEGGRIVDVKIEYVDSFEAQMLEYANEYSFLPTYN